MSFNQQKLHKVGYFRELLAANQDIDDGLWSLLRKCRDTVVRLGKTESALVRSFGRDPMLREHIEQLMTIPAVGPITALRTAACGVAPVRATNGISSYPAKACSHPASGTKPSFFGADRILPKNRP